MKELQSGRSMIEMLGVLAIIGVLSIGGLAGYTMAMNRHRANTIMDFVSRCAVTAQTHGDGTQSVANKTCADYMSGETAPQGDLANYVLAGAAGSDTFTVTTPAVTEAVFKALEARSSSSVTINGAAATGAVFTFNR